MTTTATPTQSVLTVRQATWTRISIRSQPARGATRGRSHLCVRRSVKYALLESTQQLRLEVVTPALEPNQIMTTTRVLPANRVLLAQLQPTRQLAARRAASASTLQLVTSSAQTVLLGSMTMIITHPQFALRVPLASRQTPVPIQPAAPNVDLVGTKQTGCVHVVSPVNTMTTATKLLCARTALLGRWVQKRELPAVLVAQQDSTVPKGRRLAPTALLGRRV